MKKIENVVIEVILMEEFNFDGDIKEGYAVEEVAVRAVEDTHGIFLGGEDGFVGGLEVFEFLDNQLAVEFAEFVVVGEGEVGDGAVTLEVAFERLGVGYAGDQEKLGVRKRQLGDAERMIVRAGLGVISKERYGIGIVYI